jgi:hypothetical protein
MFMDNLSSSDQRRDFFVFVDPNDWLTRHQLALIGSFSSSPADASAPKLMLLRNPEFQTFISPFQNNLVRNYMAEYNLELCREQDFAHYPCRLQAIFLFDTEEDARKYLARHHNHVGGRLLKRCQRERRPCLSAQRRCERRQAWERPTCPYCGDAFPRRP